jgi:hypothetical protein
MIIRRAAVLGAILVAAAALSSGHHVGAQNAALLDLEAQTLFVDDDPAEVVLRVRTGSS